MPKFTSPQSTAVGDVSYTIDSNWWQATTTVTNRSSIQRDGSWSLAMIVKDEADLIGRVLEDASYVCDEMVVVDTGSIDDTKAIALEHGAMVFDFPWSDDFSAARNFSFAQCRSEWVLWLDADDVIPQEARVALEQLKKELRQRPAIDVVKISYRYAFADSDPKVCVVSQQRERVIRRESGPKWRGKIHETLPIRAGRVMSWPQAWVEHRPAAGHFERSNERNLRALENEMAAGDNSFDTLFHRARALLALARWEEALAAFQQCQQHPEMGRASAWVRYAALERMAECSEKLGRQDDKYQFLLKAVDVNPNRAEALVGLGVHHYELRQWTEAVPFFEKATQLTRPAEGIIKDQAYSHQPWDYLAVCYGELGRNEEAIDAVNQALPTCPDRERLLANRHFYKDRLAMQQGDRVPEPGLH